MAPVAGAVTDAQKNRLILDPCFGESLLAPWVPVHRIIRVLEKVRACLIFQMITQILTSTSVFQITRCRVVDQLSILCEAGTMAGAIP